MLGPAIAKGAEFLMFVESLHIQVANEMTVRGTLPAAAKAFDTSPTTVAASAASVSKTAPTNTPSASLRDSE